MNTMLAGWRRLLRRKGVWAQIACIAAGEAGFVAWWLTLAVATAWDLALHVFVLLLMAGLAVLAWQLMRKAFPPARGPLWSAAPVALAAGVLLPAVLVWWVPGFESLGAQAASAAVRLTLAAALFSGALVWLAACRAED